MFMIGDFVMLNIELSVSRAIVLAQIRRKQRVLICSHGDHRVPVQGAESFGEPGEVQMCEALCGSACARKEDCERPWLSHENHQSQVGIVCNMGCLWLVGTV